MDIGHICYTLATDVTSAIKSRNKDPRMDPYGMPYLLVLVKHKLIPGYLITNHTAHVFDCFIGIL